MLEFVYATRPFERDTELTIHRRLTNTTQGQDPTHTPTRKPFMKSKVGGGFRVGQSATVKDFGSLTNLLYWGWIQ